MVEKSVPLARGGVVASCSSGGQNHPSAVATLAAEHPQNTDILDFKVSPPWPCGIDGCAELFTSFYAWLRHHKDAHPNADMWLAYEGFLWMRLGGFSVDYQRSVLEQMKQSKQDIIYGAVKEITVVNKLLEELKKK